MVEIELCKAIREFVAHAVKDLELPVQVKNDGGDEYFAHKVPKIVNGYLPPKRSQKEDDIPFIMVRPDAGTTADEETRVEVSIIFGAYSKTDDGYEHCMNMLTVVRTALLSMPFGVLAKRYILERELSWQNYPDHLDAYWQVDLKTVWRLRTVIPTNPEY